MIDEKLLKAGVIIEIMINSDGNLKKGEKYEIISTNPIDKMEHSYPVGTIKYLCKNLKTGEIHHFWPGCGLIRRDYFRIIEYENYEIY